MHRLNRGEPSRGSAKSASVPSQPAGMLERLESRVLLSAAHALPISITGTVFNDLNVDGIRQAADKGLGGRKVFVDANGNGVLDKGEVFARTDSHGNFALRGLPAGTYTIREALPRGARNTMPSGGVYTVTLADGQVVTGQDFGETKLAQISGVVFRDDNSNGAQDSGEIGLSGWQVFIDKNKNGHLDSREIVTTTDANGNYVLNGKPGLYRIREVVQTGATETSPPGGVYVVRMKPGQVVAGMNFGNFTGAGSGTTVPPTPPPTPPPPPPPSPPTPPPPATDGFVISSTRAASSAYGGFDIITFYAKDTQTGSWAGSSKILGEDLTLSSGSGLMIRASGGKADFSGATVTPTASFISLGPSFFVALTSPTTTAITYQDKQTVTSFEVQGVLIGGVNATGGSGAEVAVAIVPHGAQVTLSGQIGADVGPTFDLTPVTV